MALATMFAFLLLLLWTLGWRLEAYPTPLTDLGSYFLPKYQYAADRISSGQIPLWNPYEFGGIPFLATLQPAVFYPPIRLAYGLFSGETAYIVSFFLHLVLGATATLFLLRELRVRLWPGVFASLWVLQPTWIMRVWDHPVYIWATVWIPLLILLVRSLARDPQMRTAGLLALVAAIQILSGYPPLILATIYLLALGLPFFLLEGRTQPGATGIGRSAILLATATVVTALITAVQILPTAELMTLSERSEEAAAFAQTAEAIARDIPKLAFFVGIPPANFSTALYDFWFVYGPVLLFLASSAVVLCWRSAFLWYALAATVLAALLPLDAYRYLPLYNLVRFALEWAFIAPMLVYLLAGLGLDALLRRSTLATPRVAILTIMLLGLTTVWNWQMIDPGWRQAKVDLNLTVPEWIERECELANPEYRAFWPRGQLRGSLMANQIRSLGGYEQSLIPGRIAQLNRKLEIGNGAFNVESAAALARHRGAASRLGLRCVILDASPALARAGFEELSAATPPFAYRNPEALSRARLAFAPAFAASPEEALSLMFSDQTADVILEGEPEPLAPCPQADQGSATIVVDEPERVRVDVESPCAGYLLLADSHVPNWTATLDGAPVAIQTADYALRAVQIPPGRHSIVFTYSTWTLPVGALASGLGLILAVLMVRNRSGRNATRAR